MIRLSLLRHRPRESVPAGWVVIYLRPEFGDVVSRVEAAREPVLRLVERQHGVRIAEVVQKIVAVNLTAAQARTLKSSAGKAALHVTRQYLDPEDRLLMATDALYPSDRFSHNTRFRIQQEH
jgi:DNA-binding GntR family transcriptional regulator